MPRALKPYEIKTVTLEGASGGLASSVLYLDRNTTTFFADYAGEHYTGNDAASVERTVREAMRASLSVTWRECISVSWGERSSFDHSQQGVGENNGGAQFRFSFSRFLWARFPDGKLRKLEHWDYRTRPNEDKLSAAHTFHPNWMGGPWPRSLYATSGPRGEVTAPEFDPPCRGREAHSNVEAPHMYLPYSDEMWLGLSLLTDQVVLLSKRLADLLGSTEGQARIAAAYGVLALMAPREPAEEKEEVPVP